MTSDCCILILIAVGLIMCYYYKQKKETLNTDLAFDSVQTDYMSDGMGKGMPLSARDKYGGNSLSQLDGILMGRSGY